MEMIPASWSIRRRGFFPILEAKGECQNKLGEPFLLGTAIEFIEKAEMLNGRLLSEEPMEKSTCQVAVYFTVIFPSESELNEFIATITQQ